MKTLLTCLPSVLLLLPAAAVAERPAGRPTPKEARTDKPQPATPTLETQPEREAPRPKDRGPNEERDPERRQRYETRRASAVEARHLGRTLAELGRRTRSPLWLLTAAQLLQRVPPGRPMGQPGGSDEGRNLLQMPGQAEQAPILQAGGLLAEARLLARTQAGPLQRQELALIDAVEASEVVTRGAALGPQSTCEGVGPQSKLTYHVAYEGGERAALGVSGAGPGDLLISISDEEGNLVSRTFDRSLVSWYPRWRAVFRIDIENRSPHRVEFCIETN